jgi:signal transduction histidine kinase
MVSTAALRAIVASTLAVTVMAAPVAGANAKAILVLHTYGHEAPGRGPFDLALTRTFREATDVPVDLYIETLDSGRFGALQAQHTRAYLRAKYGDRQLAVVVAVYDAALAFVLDQKDPLFPGVPVAAVSVGRVPANSEGVSVVIAGNTIGQSVALALGLHPGTRRIAIVSGAIEGGGGDAAEREARRQIEALGVRLPITFLHTQALDELLAEVQSLPEDTVILISRLTVRQAGQPMSNPRAARAISRAARVPVYVISDHLIGSGPIGGVVIRLEDQASQLAQVALKIAGGARNIASADTALTPMFDWRELRRWGISEARLPAGSTVLFRQPNVWDQYKVYIAGVAIALGLQSVMIAGLVLQSARRRRTELALRKSEQHARETAERNQDLAGRLINAQEAERTRIARDLHDDLSQQLAGLSMMLSGLKRKTDKVSADADIDRTIAALQVHTTALADSIRDISHELHPSVLEHAGLAATLERHCADVEKHHGITVSFSADDNHGSLTPDVALCLFRVAQEALTNAVRHARPGTIRVTLTVTNESIALSVVDDGIGFVPDSGSGLGLRSIDERVRLAKGHITLESQPGRGTSLLVRVPLATAPRELVRVRTE